MAFSSASTGVSGALRRVSPAVWLAGFVAGSGWIGGNWAGWPIYAGHWALGALMAWLLVRERRLPRRGRPVRVEPVPIKALWPGWLLGLWMGGLALWRQEYAMAGMTLGTAAVMTLWGRGAYALGRGAPGIQGGGRIPEGLLATLGAGLVMGITGWAFRAFWPAACVAVNCPPETLPPYSFLAGWPTPAHWWLHWLLITPSALPTMVLLYRNPHGGRERWLLISVLGLATLSLLPGAAGWELALLVAWSAGVIYYLGPLTRREDVRPLRHAAILLAGGALVVYGLFPGYLNSAGRGQLRGAQVRVEAVDVFPGALSSEKAATLEVRLINTGLITLFAKPHERGTLRPMLLITPERGETRIVAAAGVALTEALAPGRSIELRLPVRVPHWARSGYLAWRIEQAGREIPTAESAAPGFRFVNQAYRDITATGENDLTALAARARAIATDTEAPEVSPARQYSVSNMLGGLFDTLFFSPLWGLGSNGGQERFPFASPWPFWPRLWHDYGLVGLALGLWFLARLYRMARAAARREVRVADRMTWTLLRPVLIITGLTGLFSPVLGAYHGVWALFLLGGYVEGRYDHWFRPRTPIGSIPRRRSLLGRRPKPYSIPRRPKRRWR